MFLAVICFTISVGTSLNDQTHFKKFLYNKGSGTDFLGFDNGFRSLKGGINAVLSPINNGYDLLNNGLNNDWTVKDRRPLADLSLNMNFSAVAGWDSMTYFCYIRNSEL